MSKDRNLETAIRDAERNYSVGRIVDAARDFQTISIIYGGMKNYVSAAKFAIKSGDCWVECSEPLRAGGMYESAAQCFERLSDEDNYRLYYKKALVQCILADRKAEEIGKVALARNLRRAAVCQSKIDERVSVCHYYSRAGELFISAAKDSLDKELFDEAFDFFNSAAECYFQIKEYFLSISSRVDGLICLNNLFESYLSLLKEEEYREIMKRELKRFNAAFDGLLNSLELVEQMDNEILKRVMLELVKGLRTAINSGDENVEMVRLLERMGKIVREKGAGEFGKEILVEVLPNFNFNNPKMKEEFDKTLELLKSLLEDKS
ncbi:MAG: hypothetical protein ACUVXA_00695 [Candidatus Jordarchaeum sp.]|uniref:hypothetical protein n=1 Tax=Candidatus Jordarchaeum sp. TaxID=2823881 RepID=UPI004049B675